MKLKNALNLSLLSLLLSSLSSCKVTNNPPESFNAFLVRTEGLDCDTATFSEEDVPKVDCKELYQAFNRGRNLVATLPEYTEKVKSVRMGQFYFIRPKLTWTAYPGGQVIPLINILPEPQVYLVGGITSPTFPILIEYGLVEVVEHEAVHAIVESLDPARLRIGTDLAEDSILGSSPYFFQILCHQTSDDPLGKAGTWCQRRVAVELLK